MSSKHKVILANASKLEAIANETVDLVVTSPPYPMIEMWDEMMIKQDALIAGVLNDDYGAQAFERMHVLLDAVWQECGRVLKPGGVACVNIGDATRTINGQFQMYSNHMRIIQTFLRMGFSNMPNILWRKATNSPNKFMGSGMYPPGAYVTLEHEFILIFRKGGKRIFKSEADKINRRESAYFWEERNQWFSDMWDLRGTRQNIADPKTRKRSAAYPFELPYRLINMFSVKGDTILDPFLGTGTSTLAAIASKRNSIGVEMDKSLYPTIDKNLIFGSSFLNEMIKKRLGNHKAFVKKRTLEKGKEAFKYTNTQHGFPVVTRQEILAKFDWVKSIRKEDDFNYTAEYEDFS